MNKDLLAIIACPICKGQLIYDPSQQELICRSDRLAFPIENGVPIMLKTRARVLAQAEKS